MSPAAARKRSWRSRRRRRRGGHSLSPSLFALAPLCTAAKRAEGRKDARRGPRFVNIETTDNLESALGKREREKKKSVSHFSPHSASIVGKRRSLPMPPKEAAAAAPPARTVTPITCAYEELLRQEPHVLAAVEKVRCFKKKAGGKKRCEIRRRGPSSAPLERRRRRLSSSPPLLVLSPRFPPIEQPTNRPTRPTVPAASASSPSRESPASSPPAPGSSRSPRSSRRP